DREVQRLLIAPNHRDRLTATLPAIAVWTVMHGAAVKLPEVFDLRQLINEPRRDQQHPPVDALARLENNGEAAITALHVFNFHFAKLNRVVTPKLIAADLQELRW